MGQSSNNQKQTSNLDFVREKFLEAFPGLQLLASNVIDQACFFSDDAIPMDDDVCDFDNAILHCGAFDELEQEQQQQQGQQHQHETTIAASKSLTERTAITHKVQNYVYLEAANPSLTDEVEARSAFYFKSPSFSADTATTYCKSYGSASSILSHQSGATISWSDLDDESDHNDEDEVRSGPPSNFYREVMVIRRAQSVTLSDSPYFLVSV